MSVYRAFTLVNDFTRECPVLKDDTSLTGERVTRGLGRLALIRGLPKCIACDNESEFAGQLLDQRAHDSGVTQSFIESRKPVQNAHAESFNGTLPRLRHERKLAGRCSRHHRELAAGLQRSSAA